MPRNRKKSASGMKVLGWLSLSLVIVTVPLSTTLFTGLAILPQFLVITAGIAAAKNSILPAILTAVVYTFTVIYIAPGFFFEAFSDSTNRGLPLLVLFTVFNYGVFTIGLSVGIYRRYLSTRNDYA